MVLFIIEWNVQTVIECMMIFDELIDGKDVLAMGPGHGVLYICAYINIYIYRHIHTFTYTYMRLCIIRL